MTDWCEKNGHTNIEIFTDHGISGAKESRPSLNRMMEKVEDGLCKQVVVFSFSRFARSTTHLPKALEKFREKKVRFHSILRADRYRKSDGIGAFYNSWVPFTIGKRINSRRVRAGMKNAKAKGVRIGRERKRNDVLIQSLLEAGLSFREIARISKCSHGSVSASKKEWLQKKSDAERIKFDQLTTEIGKSQLADTVAQMKTMNLDDQVVQKVQEKLENDARENVRQIQGAAAYETYD